MRCLWSASYPTLPTLDIVCCVLCMCTPPVIEGVPPPPCGLGTPDRSLWAPPMIEGVAPSQVWLAYDQRGAPLPSLGGVNKPANLSLLASARHVAPPPPQCIQCICRVTVPGTPMGAPPYLATTDGALRG